MASASTASRCYCSSGDPLSWIAAPDAASASAAPSAAGTPVQGSAMERLLSACVDLCDAAGAVIRSIYSGGDLRVIDKSVSGSVASSRADCGDRAKMDALEDPQTAADTAAQRILIGSLSKLFPTLTIIGEEGEQTVESGDIRSARLDLLRDISFPSAYGAVECAQLALWVDPLDGTKEYTVGNTDGVTILLGITDKRTGRAIGGVIHQPFRQRTVWSAVGVGCFGAKPDEAKIAQRKRDNVLSVATTRTHASPLLAAAVEWIGAKEILRIGGAGAKGLLVLDGVTDAYFFPTPGTKFWDIAAVDACVHASGGCLTDAFGAPIAYRPLAGADSSSDPQSLANAYANRVGIIATRDRALHPRLVLDRARVEEFNAKAASKDKAPAKI